MLFMGHHTFLDLLYLGGLLHSHALFHCYYYY